MRFSGLHHLNLIYLEIPEAFSDISIYGFVESEVQKFIPSKVVGILILRKCWKAHCEVVSSTNSSNQVPTELDELFGLSSAEGQ